MSIPGLVFAAFLILIALASMSKRRPGRKLSIALKVFGKSPQLGGFNELVATCASLGVQPAVGTTEWDTGIRVLITGSPTPEQLKEICGWLKEAGSYPLVVRDAVTNFEELRATLEELNEHQRVQIVTSEATIALLKAKGSQYLYAFPKADCTATVAVLFQGGKKVLVIRRKFAPFKDWMTLPGGFLDILLETLTRCGVRELMEEVFAKAHREGRTVLHESDLRLVDVRSDPDRDPRGHIVDHGYVWLVPAEREAEVIAEICPGDDAAKVWLEDTKVVLEKGLAFDHIQLLRAALELLGIKLS
jgi:8-oxo-dGTP diphosphatase